LRIGGRRARGRGRGGRGRGGSSGERRGVCGRVVGAKHLASNVGAEGAERGAAQALGVAAAAVVLALSVAPILTLVPCVCICTCDGIGGEIVGGVAGDAEEGSPSVRARARACARERPRRERSAEAVQRARLRRRLRRRGLQVLQSRELKANAVEAALRGGRDVRKRASGRANERASKLASERVRQ